MNQAWQWSLGRQTNASPEAGFSGITGARLQLRHADGVHTTFGVRIPSNPTMTNSSPEWLPTTMSDVL